MNSKTKEWKDEEQQRRKETFLYTLIQSNKRNSHVIENLGIGIHQAFKYERKKENTVKINKSVKEQINIYFRDQREMQ